MSRLFSVLMVIWFVLGCSNSENIPSTQKAKFSEELSALKEYFQIPGLSVLVGKGDQIIYEDYMGLADIDLKVPMDSVTTLQMASLTKMFSAIVLGQLVDEGKLSLNESLRVYSENSNIGDSIKVKNALSHTSQGIPGQQFYYNNSRFMLLGDVIEKTSGKDFKTNMYERIINPLKLKNTYLLRDSLQLVTEKRKVAQPNFLGGEPQDGYMVKESNPGFIDYGYSTAAGISSTVRDLFKLSRALDKNMLITNTFKDKMFNPFGPDLPYGLGVFTQEFLDEKLVWGYGQYDCYSSLFLKVPKRDLTFIIAANNNLMSDPARLIAGDVSYSLFALSFLKNFVLDLEEEPLFEDQATLKSLEDRLTKNRSEFIRKKLMAQSLAATFMSRYSDIEGDLSKQILDQLFKHFPDYQDYGDLVLVRNLYMLKFMDDIRDREEFTDFDNQFREIGEILLEADENNPYANFYMANFFQIKEIPEKSLEYYKNIVEAENFSPWWYTREAQKWIDENVPENKKRP
ncbi:serine hydrolase domain-containing protein [Ulvibacterium marinum]|uniref:serine hydrolase domain-containing protein n=1 Tax=Ulvibacterium marinum TaxID=2419782 RepID=UPI002494C73A|nr:serine hydrolase domain-containing protein [Ulvibacterium marinum]